MTTLAHSWFASPLSLIDAWRDGGSPLREVLITGFTVDLAFLERVCIPQARALGARITILTDPTQALHDPVDVRWAGRAYQHAFAIAPRAFHPKLALLVGDEQIWAAVGSGNPTMAGWAHNHELWWVLRGSRDEGPAAQAQLADWLTALPDHVGMPTWIASTARDIADQVRPRRIAATHDDVTVVHNLTAPILDALPTAARHLRLAAPFYDPSGHAIREVANRCAPTQISVALQSRLGHFDGPALADAIRDSGARSCTWQRTAPCTASSSSTTPG